MGADFIYAIAEWDHDTDRETIEARVANIPLDHLTTNFELDGLFFTELEELEQEEIDEDEALTRLRERIMESYDYLAGDYRDTGWFWDGDRQYVLSGGMSAGDDPTEAYEHIRVIAAAGVTENGVWD